MLASVPDGHDQAAIDSMRTLNRAASEALVAAGAPPHRASPTSPGTGSWAAWEMADRSGASRDRRLLPPRPSRGAGGRSVGVRTGAVIPAREYVGGRAEAHAGKELEALAYDPQTSGRLLAAVPGVVDELAGLGFVEIGEVVAGQPGISLR